jgi:hypothetical protein
MQHPRYTGWHKSSYSNSSANCVEVGTASAWRKSSYSNSSANCVEVSAAVPVVGVRDSKQHARGPVLEFTAAAWEAFMGKAKRGEYDR